VNGLFQSQLCQILLVFICNSRLWVPFTVALLRSMHSSQLCEQQLQSDNAVQTRN
jgi:hypothetical protein